MVSLSRKVTQVLKARLSPGGGQGVIDTWFVMIPGFQLHFVLKLYTQTKGIYGLQ